MGRLQLQFLQHQKHLCLVRLYVDGDTWEYQPRSVAIERRAASPLAHAGIDDDDIVQVVRGVLLCSRFSLRGRVLSQCGCERIGARGRGRQGHTLGQSFQPVHGGSLVQKVLARRTGGCRGATEQERTFGRRCLKFSRVMNSAKRKLNRPQISTADKTHARTGPDTQRAQAHNHTQNNRPMAKPNSV